MPCFAFLLVSFSYMCFCFLGAGHVTRVESILTARVPIVKFVDLGTGIECDLSVDNRDGIEKSEIIHQISAIDERFKKLSVLVSKEISFLNYNLLLDSISSSKQNSK